MAAFATEQWAGYENPANAVEACLPCSASATTGELSLREQENAHAHTRSATRTQPVDDGEEASFTLQATPPRQPLRRLRRLCDREGIPPAVSVTSCTDTACEALADRVLQAAESVDSTAALGGDHLSTGEQEESSPPTCRAPEAAPAPDSHAGDDPSVNNMCGKSGSAEALRPPSPLRSESDRVGAKPMAKARRRLRRKASLEASHEDEQPVSEAQSSACADDLADVLGAMQLASAPEEVMSTEQPAPVPPPAPPPAVSVRPIQKLRSVDALPSASAAATLSCAEVAAPTQAMQLTHGASGAEFALNSRLAGRLYAHQREGVAWLWSRHTKGCGGILADDMGLGKTVQVSAFLTGALAGGAMRTALVVAPTTLLDQWAAELRTGGLDKQVHICSAGGSRTSAINAVVRHGGVLITSYGMILHHAADFGARVENTGSDDDEADGDERQISWDWLICDEGHKLKNARMKLVACLQRLPATRRLVLTGTPVQNNLTELWALLNFAAPGMLGDAKSFREQYEKPIARGTSRDASARERQVGTATAEALRNKIAPVMLRREKRTVFAPAPGIDSFSSQESVKDDADAQSQASSSSSGCGLSSRKCDMIVWLKLTAPQRRLYASFLSSAAVSAALNKTRSALAAITVLKKICDHPGLLSERAAADIAKGQEPLVMDTETQQQPPVDDEVEEVTSSCAAIDPEASCKTAFVVHFVDQVTAQGHRTLVFSQSVRMLDGLEAALRAAGHTLCRIDGQVPAGERARRVTRFQEPGAAIPVFLLSSAVGGLGLTLTAADRVIIVDPAWNPAADAQSVDRAYRMGQTRDVAVYRLITAGTVEEKIYRKQVFKAGLSAAASGSAPGGDVARYFTSGEMRDLFACHPDGLDTPATAQALLARHAPPQDSAPDAIAKEVADTVLAQSCVAAVTDHSVLFTQADDTVAGPGELHPPVSSSLSAPSVPPAASLTPQRKVTGPPAPWRGGSLIGTGGVVAATLVTAASAVIAPPSAEELAAAAARRTAARCAELSQQMQRYSKLLLDPVTSRLPDGGAKFRAKLEALEAELAQLTGGTSNAVGKCTFAEKEASQDAGGDALTAALSALSM